MFAAQVQPIVHRMPARELSLCVRQPKILPAIPFAGLNPSDFRISRRLWAAGRSDG
jgi:hypothetical protein